MPSSIAIIIPTFNEEDALPQTLQHLRQLQFNEVIVVDGGGSRRRALLGDMLAEQAANNGWAGLVIFGVIRDVDEISETALGVKALGTCPLKTEKRGVGQRDVTLQLGGVEISPGDYAYADNNGVLISSVALL